MAVPMEHYEDDALIAMLGGRRSLGASTLHAALRKGLRYRALESLCNVLDTRPQDLAVLMGSTARTMARRKVDQVLSPLESDRLYRVARVAKLAGDTLGSLEKAGTWLKSENRALGGVTPLSQLDTEIGEHLVEDVLFRIQHGIYS